VNVAVPKECFKKIIGINKIKNHIQGYYYTYEKAQKNVEGFLPDLSLFYPEMR